jgi:hypothetical protein
MLVWSVLRLLDTESVFRSATLAKLFNHHQGLLVAVEPVAFSIRTGAPSRQRPNPTKRVADQRQAYLYVSNYFPSPHGADHPLSADSADVTDLSSVRKSLVGLMDNFL